MAIICVQHTFLGHLSQPNSFQTLSGFLCSCILLMGPTWTEGDARPGCNLKIMWTFDHPDIPAVKIKTSGWTTRGSTCKRSIAAESWNPPAEKRAQTGGWPVRTEQCKPPRQCTCTCTMHMFQDLGMPGGTLLLRGMLALPRSLLAAVTPRIHNMFSQREGREGGCLVIWIFLAWAIGLKGWRQTQGGDQYVLVVDNRAVCAGTQSTVNILWGPPPAKILPPLGKNWKSENQVDRTYSSTTTKLTPVYVQFRIYKSEFFNDRSRILGVQLWWWCSSLWLAKDRYSILELACHS